jgi:hypothetical protein
MEEQRSRYGGEEGHFLKHDTEQARETNPENGGLYLMGGGFKMLRNKKEK